MHAFPGCVRRLEIELDLRNQRAQFMHLPLFPLVPIGAQPHVDDREGDLPLAGLQRFSGHTQTAVGLKR